MLALAISVGVMSVMSNHTYKVGDIIYQQTEGGAIGLVLTTAVNRPFMFRWDRMYLDRVRKAGVKMVVYERYVDDSNQIAKVPPPGSVYDTETRKVVQSLDFPDTRNDDQRLAEVLKEIANEVMPGVVVMEEDVPSRNHDGKLAILDMKVWMGEGEYILHQHYEKDVASKKVLTASSAQSASCKQSVHTQELV